MFRTPFLLSATLLALAAGFTTASAQEKWNLDDPQIAAATFGLLAPMTADGFCPGLKPNRPRLMELMTALKVQPKAVRELCEQCYDTGLKGAQSLIAEKGKDAYCETMKVDFGKDGQYFSGLLE